MATTYISRLALLGCVSGAVLALGACSSSGRLSAGTMLGSAAALADDGAGSGASGTGRGSGSGSGSAGAGTGTTTTTGTGGGSGGGSGGGGGGGGGGNINNGGPTDTTSGTGTLARLSDLTGDLTGSLIAVTGNAVLTGTSGLGNLLTNAGGELRSDGLGGLPLVGDAVETVTRAADASLGPAAKVTLLNQTVVGSSTANSPQLVGVSALSSSTTQGQAATVGLLNGPAPTQVASLNLGGAQLLGAANGGPALIGASVLAPTTATGTAATLGLLSGSASPLPGLAPVVGSATTVVASLVSGGAGGGGSLPVLPVVSGLVQGVTGGLTGGSVPSLPVVGGLGLIAGAGGAAGGSVSAGPVTATGGLLGGLGIALVGR